MDAIIMCAGLGTRLRPLTDTIPKPLIPINGKGSLERTLEILPPDVTRIILVVGYLADHIKERIGTTFQGRPVIYVTQGVLDGTGGCLRQVKRQVEDLSDRFLVINGDDLYAASDLLHLSQVPIGLVTFQTIAPRTIDSCDVSKEGLLIGFTETQMGEAGRINIGAYCLDHRWFDTAPVRVPGKDTEWSLPHALQQLLDKGISLQVIEGTFWMPVGTPEELAAAERALAT
jgi:bifunctional UDP-N-acetylglucosamine pyrophosphorylase/glucosamine-1-phosphate N-acetyltransferase